MSKVLLAAVAIIAATLTQSRGQAAPSAPPPQNAPKPNPPKPNPPKPNPPKPGAKPVAPARGATGKPGPAKRAPAASAPRPKPPKSEAELEQEQKSKAAQEARRAKTEREKALVRQRAIDAQRRISAEAWERELAITPEERERRQKALEEFIANGGTVAEFEEQERKAQGVGVKVVPRGEIAPYVAPPTPMTVQEIRDSYLAAYELAKAELTQLFKDATVSFARLDDLRVKQRGNTLHMSGFMTTTTAGGVVGNRSWVARFATSNNGREWHLEEAILTTTPPEGDRVPRPDPD